MLRVLALVVIGASSLLGDTNFGGPYRHCDNHAELQKSGHMNIGVRIGVRDKRLVKQVRKAMDFWQNLLDLEFYEAKGTDCALAIEDAAPGLLPETGDIARAHLPTQDNFQGWIVLDPNMRNYATEDESFSAVAHELGHIFGLQHNPSVFSLMYYLDFEGSFLDQNDLRVLAILHAFKPIKVCPKN
jgi:hypothetical protein